MHNIKLFFKSRYNLFFTISSLIVFCYLLFRTINSSLVCDELSTFFYYIQPKSFFYVGNGGDANNHLLNTLLSFISSYFLGFSSFSLRVFSLLSALLYFRYTYKFSKEIKNNTTRLLFAFVMLFSFNFLQFFGLSRGYGYSFAFLLAGLYHFYIFSKDINRFRFKNLVYFYLFISLTLYANLGTLLTVLTISFFLLLFCFKKINLFLQLKTIQKSIFFITSVLYILTLLLMISFSFILKSNGALYYGNLSSFWYNVVVTQLYLLVENKSIFLQYILAAFLSLFAILSLLSQKNFKLKEYYKFNFFFLILIVNLLGIELLALLLKVNYPSDRVAIHLYLLLILALFFIDVQNNQILKSLKLTAIVILSFIPLHNILTANYKNNTVWPLDYFPKSYYNKIVDGKIDLDYYPTVSGNTFRGLNYAKFVYENNGKGNLIVPWKVEDTTLLEANNHPGKYSDFIISKEEDVASINYLYQKVDSNSVNTICLWERINKPKYKAFDTAVFNSTENFSNEYLECANITLDSLNNLYLLIDIEFELTALELPFNGSLIFNVNDEVTNQRLLYESYPIRFQKSFKTGNQFKQRLFLKKLHPNHKIKIASYLWNLEKETITISNGKVTFYKFSE